MPSHEREVDLAQVFSELYPLPEGVKLPMPRFGRAKAPPAQPLPSTGPRTQALAEAYPVPLQWIDDDLGIRVNVEYEADPADPHRIANQVWIYVEGDAPGLAGKSASVALVSEKENRFIDRLIPLQLGADNRCTGKVRVGTVDEVRAKLACDRITLDVFLME